MRIGAFTAKTNSRAYSHHQLRQEDIVSLLDELVDLRIAKKVESRLEPGVMCYEKFNVQIEKDLSKPYCPRARD